MMEAVRGGRARVFWQAERHDEARAEYRAFRDLWSPNAQGGRHVTFGVSCLDEALGALASRDDLVLIADDLRRRSQGEFRVSWHGGSEDRLVGQLELWLGNLDEARMRAERAREYCIEQRAVVEEARCEQLLAEIELAEGNREAALPLLDNAATIYDRFGLRLYLDQVIATKDILKA
jgi:tetratricopeptide (TPR) repeat protein